MHLIGFKAYRRGYVGCLADERDFTYFAFSRGAFKPIQIYPRAHFENVAHFVTSLHKFVSLGFFLRRPIPLPTLENNALQALGAHLAQTLTADAYLSLRHMAIGPMTGNRPDGGSRPDRRGREGGAGPACGARIARKPAGSWRLGH